jgi:hypothetical protein
MKKHLIMLIALVGITLVISGCGGAKLAPDVEAMFDSEAPMYTTSNIHYNVGHKGVMLADTLNPQVGILIPVNSEVTMESINRKQIIFMYGANKVILKNNPKYTGADISTIAKRYFSPTKVDLTKFSKAEQKAIRSGLVENGMSKAAVLVSLGTPPAYETPTLEMDTWKFWKSRFSSFLVTFKDGKVISNPKVERNNSGGSVSLISIH